MFGMNRAKRYPAPIPITGNQTYSTMSQPIHPFLFVARLWLGLCAVAAHGQDGALTPLSGHFLVLDGGLHYGYLRDPGVSPLIYGGPIPFAGAAWRSEQPQWELEVGGGFGYGQYKANRSFRVSTSIQNIQHRMGYFRRVMESPSGKLQLRAGLSYQGFTNYRVTSAFRNNAGVLESLHSILGGLKLQWGGLRPSPASQWFIFRRKAGLRGWLLRAECSAAFLHGSWRPDFAYLSDFTGGKVPVGKQNTWAMGGRHWYLRSELQYFMRNGNAWKIGYSADLQKSGDPFYPLETAQYLSGLGLLVRLN